jgi:fructose-1,6-bisphosphatase/sedoheptulose 1,7-bisphosphatase-like protein
MNQTLIIVFSSAITLLGTLFVLILKSLRDDVKKMTGSVDKLNEKIAVVINDQQWHKEEIEEIKKRLSKVENL